MGQLDVHIRHGGGGGTDPQIVAVVAVAAILGSGILAALAVVIEILAVILGAILVLVVAVLAWWLCTQPARKARHAEVYRAAFAAREEAEQRQALQRRQLALELARASAPVINNIIDPAAIAAAVAGAQQQHPARVLRGEVER